MSKIYRAKPEGDGWDHIGLVVIEDLDELRRLDPRNDLVNHSPDGFGWGYGGSGAAQLALAILCDATGDDTIAQRLYQSFKSQVIAKLKRGAWELRADYVLDWIARQPPAGARS